MATEGHELDHAAQRWRIGVLLFPDVELLDFCGPLEVFTVAARLLDDPAMGPEAFTVAQQEAPVLTRAGLKVVPDYTIAQHPKLDILLVPGGWGTRREVDSAALIEWIAGVAADAELTTSVCTGAFLLARAGLLGTCEVTTHWASLDRLAREYPELTVRRDVRWVDSGTIITSAGISAGIDMSLHIIARLLGEEMAHKTARQMEYHWLDADNTQAN